MTKKIKSALHSKISNKNLKKLEYGIKKYYCDNPKNYTPKKYQKIIEEHLNKRLQYNRQVVIPWIKSTTTLENMEILEIGAGTGSSTVALAEEKANVTAIDIDHQALKIAKDRLNYHGLKAELIFLNSNKIKKYFKSKKFNIIMFFASLEHMTYQERISTLKQAWSLLKKDGLLIIIETPNRLWYRDTHTTDLPFLHWLPDEIATTYIKKFYQEDKNSNLANKKNLLKPELLIRQGRGVSFHEFELAIKPIDELKVISNLNEFKFKYIKKLINIFSSDGRYMKKIKDQYPSLPQAFLQSYLNIVIKK